MLLPEIFRPLLADGWNLSLSRRFWFSGLGDRLGFSGLGDRLGFSGLGGRVRDSRKWRGGGWSSMEGTALAVPCCLYLAEQMVPRTAPLTSQGIWGSVSTLPHIEPIITLLCSNPLGSPVEYRTLWPLGVEYTSAHPCDA